MRLTDFLDLLGVLCLTSLAFLIWPPAALGVFGVACIVASWSQSRSGGEGK